MGWLICDKLWLILVLIMVFILVLAILLIIVLIVIPILIIVVVDDGSNFDIILISDEDIVCYYRIAYMGYS